MALINLRNALMAGKRLPYDAEVEYLESTGTQWIDTGVAGKSTDSIEISFQPTSSTGDQKFFGSLRSLAVGYYRNKWHFGFGNWASYDIASDVNPHVVSYDGGTLKLDGTSVVDATIGTYDYTYKIFAATNNSGATLTGSVKFFRAQIWDNGVLVRDFIPVRVGTTGYLYDRVSGQLFGNAGAGDFVVGPDVVPVEYIESHGTEWIDLGVDSTADGFADFDLTFQSTASGGSRLVPFGYQYGGTARYGHGRSVPMFGVSASTTPPMPHLTQTTTRMSLA